MDEHFQITDDERNDVVKLADKVSGLGGFIGATRPTELAYAEEAYSDISQLL